jgi:hypothetical protein
MMCGAAGGTQPANLDDLPGNGKAAIFAEPAQALYDRLILDFFGGPAIVADHKLAFVRVLDIVAGDKSAGTLDLMDQLVRKQKIERAVYRRRTELATLVLQFGKHCIGADRLIGSEDQFEHPVSYRRQSRTPRRAELLGAPERALDVPRSQQPFPRRLGVIYAAKVQRPASNKQQSDRGQIGSVDLG